MVLFIVHFILEIRFESAINVISTLNRQVFMTNTFGGVPIMNASSVSDIEWNL